VAVVSCASGTGVVAALKVVNQRRYPLLLSHPDLSVMVKAPLDRTLAAVSHFGSKGLTVLGPGDQVTYAADIKLGTETSATTQFDSFGQSLTALQVGAETLVAIVSRFGFLKSTNAVEIADTFLQAGDCAAALGRGPAKLLVSCFGPAELNRALGAAGAVVAAAYLVGGVVAFFQSEFDALGDQFNGRDTYKLTLRHEQQTPSGAPGGNVISKTGIGSLSFGMTIAQAESALVLQPHLWWQVVGGVVGSFCAGLVASSPG